MIVKPYTRDYESAITRILFKRGMDVNLINDLPKFGLIAVKRGIVIAFGGILEVEGSRGLLDSFITNPEASSEDRNRALDLVTYKLLRIAKSNDVKYVMALSLDKDIRDRASRHGFTSYESAHLQIARV